MVVRADNNYYDLLGVPRDADKKTIKTAYRSKARKYHPVRFCDGLGILSTPLMCVAAWRMA